MPMPTRTPFHPVIKARIRFLLGPGAGTWIEPGDILDLSDPGWGLPTNRAEKLVEHNYGEATTDDVTRTPGVEDFTPPPVSTPSPLEQLELAEPLTCTHCPRTFPTAHGLAVHMGREHKE